MCSLRILKFSCSGSMAEARVRLGLRTRVVISWSPLVLDRKNLQKSFFRLITVNVDV